MPEISFTLNGKPTRLTVDPERMLLWVLRDDLGLTGTKFGCGQAVCGSCTVLVDDEPVRSCVTSMADVTGKKVLTIEGLANGDRLHPIQQAFVDHTAFQCSYCTPGFILTTKALLEENADPTRDEAKEYLAGNLCRCGSYVKILDAVMDAKERVRTTD